MVVARPPFLLSGFQEPYTLRRNCRMSSSLMFRPFGHVILRWVEEFDSGLRAGSTDSVIWLSPGRALKSCIVYDSHHSGRRPFWGRPYVR
jgi:hypothetical protein